MNSTTPHGDDRSKVRDAFTLLEVLLALTLMSLVMALTGRLAVHSLQSRTAAENIFERIQREAYVFDRIADDVSRLLPLDSDGASPVAVYGAPRQILQLHVLADMPDHGGGLHMAKRPATVHYRLLRRADPAAGYELIRETLDRTGHDAGRVRETIGNGLDWFEVAVWHAGKWQKRFPPATEIADPVRALRITCRWLGEDERITRTIALEASTVE